jgi:hypothetical protein
MDFVTATQGHREDSDEFRQLAWAYLLRDKRVGHSRRGWEGNGAYLIKPGLLNECFSFLFFFIFLNRGYLLYRE